MPHLKINYNFSSKRGHLRHHPFIEIPYVRCPMFNFLVAMSYLNQPEALQFQLPCNCSLNIETQILIPVRFSCASSLLCTPNTVLLAEWTNLKTYKINSTTSSIDKLRYYQYFFLFALYIYLRIYFLGQQVLQHSLPGLKGHLRGLYFRTTAGNSVRHARFLDNRSRGRRYFRQVRYKLHE